MFAVKPSDIGFSRWLAPMVVGTAVGVVGASVLAAGFGEADVEPTAIGYLFVALAAVAATVGIAMAEVGWVAFSALVFLAVARIVVVLEGGAEFVVYPALAVALYTTARSGPRGPRLAMAAIVASSSAVAVAALDDEPFWFELAGELALAFLPFVAADSVRARQDRLTERINTEAEARVAAERLRIARDLHDVVAHGLSTIAVQSGVAAHLIDRDPDQAKEALEAINATGKRSLEELRAMVGVLRSTDDETLLPVPTAADDLSNIIDNLRSTGLDVTLRVDGHFPGGVVDSAKVAVHRIIQEALTNVVRHAGQVRAVVAIEHGDEAATLEVVNEPASAPSAAVPSSGVGIVGMAERAESLGGQLVAEPTADGGFAVKATVPYRLGDTGSRT